MEETLELSTDYLRTRVKEERKIYRGLDSFVFSWRGRSRRHGRVDEFRRQAIEVHARIKAQTDLADVQLREEIEKIRTTLTRKPKWNDEVIFQAVALASTVAARTMKLVPYEVQIMGALAIAHGYLAEMATGEGKTLTVALAAAIAGWGGRPVHVITANDYLAARDAKLLRPFYEACGLTVGSVTGTMQPVERRLNYEASVTYTTPKDVLADFLRDRIQVGNISNPTRRLLRAVVQKRPAKTSEFVMRGLHWAIVDEADSVLIDEAVTPLIISQPVDNEALRKACELGAEMAAKLRPGVDYEVDFKYRDVHLRQTALREMAGQANKLPPMWRSSQRQAEILRTALIARELYQRGIHYVVQDDKIELVDEFTGRIMPHRTWQQGLHQAVEAKEGIPITAPSETMASLSFQRFFRCYPRMAGVSGTAMEAAEEFWQIYHLAVLAIPTHRPCQRIYAPPHYFPTVEDKWNAVLEEIERVHALGRPILVGTRSIAASEELSSRLNIRGMPHHLLNASRNSEEAEIVSKAGQAGQITIATNMAGRGTDIALGEGVTELGGLHVIATEMHESGRIDRQLFGRSARQGDPGSAELFVSMEDDLLNRYLPAPVIAPLRQNTNAGSWLVRRAFQHSQKTAERLAYRQRKKVLENDRWLDENLSFSGRGGAV